MAEPFDVVVAGSGTGWVRGRHLGGPAWAVPPSSSARNRPAHACTSAAFPTKALQHTAERLDQIPHG